MLTPGELAIMAQVLMATPRSQTRLTMHQPPIADEPAAPASSQETAGNTIDRSWPIRRLEYALLASAAVILTALALLFLLLGIGIGQLGAYGYFGLFAVSLISAASIILPMPGAAAVASAGALFDPVLGIPAHIMVGLVSGPAEALGECTGYAAGYGGSTLFRDRPVYSRVRGWMKRRGILTMFLLASFPNPLLDVAGVAAGAVQMRLWHFFVGVLAGKVFKNIYLASGGLAAAELIRRLF